MQTTKTQVPSSELCIGEVLKERKGQTFRIKKRKSRLERIQELSKLGAIAKYILAEPRNIIYVIHFYIKI